MAVPHPARTGPRVDVSGPNDVHILPQVYHGDGVGGRSLVYNGFGLDLLDGLGRLGMLTHLHHYEIPERPVNAATALVSVKRAG
jgi:hypothetical protein